MVTVFVRDEIASDKGKVPKETRKSSLTLWYGRKNNRGEEQCFC